MRSGEVIPKMQESFEEYDINFNPEAETNIIRIWVPVNNQPEEETKAVLTRQLLLSVAGIDRFFLEYAVDSEKTVYAS